MPTMLCGVGVPDGYDKEAPARTKKFEKTHAI